MSSNPYNRSRFTGFSLWLRPPEEASVKIFRPLIKEYNEEPFEPHITLLAPIEHLGEWEIIEKLETLKSSMGSFQVTIKKAAYRDAYFQCVFALCQKSQKLLEAHEKAKNIMFEDQPESAPSSYMPHLSIIYGNLTEQQREERCKDIDAEIRNVSFDVDSVELWDTHGRPSDWVKIFEVPLVNNSTE